MMICCCGCVTEPDSFVERYRFQHSFFPVCGSNGAQYLLPLLRIVGRIGFVAFQPLLNALLHLSCGGFRQLVQFRQFRTIDAARDISFYQVRCSLLHMGNLRVGHSLPDY